MAYWTGTGALSTYAGLNTAYGSSMNNVQLDPQFTNTSGTYSTSSDFTLKSTSPAIDSGINLGSPYNLRLSASSTWPSNIVTVDQNTKGNAWDIGAYVYTQTTPPSVTITSPTNGSNVSGTQTITGTASATSPASVSSVAFYVDGSTLLGTSVSTTSPSFSWNTSGTTNGTHSLSAVATDNYGNISTSTVSNITVNNVVASGGSGGAVYPSFSGIQVSSTTPTSTVISYITNYPNGSAIDYGLTTSYGSAVSSSTATTTHNLNLTNLTPATLYHFRVKDPYLADYSPDYTFTTLTVTGTVVTVPATVTATSTPTSTPSSLPTTPQTGITIPTVNIPPTISVILPYNVHDGQLLQFKGNPTIYLVKPNGLYPFDTYPSFQQYQSQSGEKLTVLKGTKNPYTIQSQTASQILGQAPTSSPAPTAVNQATGLIPADITFTRNLGYLSKGDDVKVLQQFLNQNNFPVAPNGQIGSPGHETTLFGLATKAALKSFQNKYKAQIGIKAGTGIMDTATRNFINSLR